MVVGTLSPRRARLAAWLAFLAPQELLSGRALEQRVFGSVDEWQITADSRQVVYRESVGAEECGLFVQDLRGAGEPVALEGVLSRESGRFRIAPGGKGVVYVADLDADGRRELALSALGGGPAHRLSSALPAGFEVDAFALGAGGECAYRSSGPTNQPALHDLFALALGSSAAPANLTAAIAERVLAFELAGDRAVFHAGLLRSAPLDGSAAPVAFDRTGPFAVAPDGRTVVMAVPSGPLFRDLWSAPSDASAPTTLLNAGLDALEEIRRFEIDPTGARVVFSTEQSIGLGRLFSAPLGGGAPMQRLDVAPADGLVLDFEIDPAGARVAYARVASSGSRLAVAPIAGGAATPLDALAPLPATAERLAFTRDGSRLVFGTRAVAGVAGRLCSVATDGLAPAVELDASSAALHEIDPSGSWVGFVARGDDGAFRLWLVPIGGGSAPVRVDEGVPPLVSASFSPETAPLFPPDGARLVYRSAERLAGVGELFSRALDLSQPGARLSRPTSFLTLGDVTEVALDGVGARAAFAVDYEGPDRLFAVELLPPYPLVALDLGGSVGDLGPAPALGATPDGRSVLFVASVDGSSYHLRCAATDGASETFSFPGALALSGGAFRFLIDPSGTRVVYRDEGALIGAPISPDAATQAVLLTGAAQLVGASAPFELALDGSRVLYVGGSAPAARRELYSAPIAGGAPPAQLSSFAFGTGAGVVERFVLVPDGARVAYLADQLVAGQVEVFSAPLDGSAPSVRVSRMAHAAGDASALACGAGGLVVYAADSETDGLVELWGAPIDGSAEPVRLSAPMASNRDVGAFALGAREIVYVADRDANDVFELFGSSLDGARHWRLHEPLPALADVDSPALAGRRVLYAADPFVDGARELFSASLAGVGPRGSAQVRLAPGLVLAQDGAAASLVSPDGKRALLRGRRAGGGLELFHAGPSAERAERVDGPRVEGALGVTRAWWTADSARALWLGELREPGRVELFTGAFGAGLARRAR